MSEPRRIFMVGTDTGVGKTTVTCALLGSAARAGLIAIPCKPAESGPEGPTSDRARLLAASRLGPRELERFASDLLECRAGATSPAREAGLR